MTTKAEIGVMQLQAKECQGLVAITGTRKRWNDPSLEPSEGAGPYPHLDF